MLEKCVVDQFEKEGAPVNFTDFQTLSTFKVPISNSLLVQSQALEFKLLLLKEKST